MSVCSFTKSVLQSSKGLVQKEWGLDGECMQPSRFLNRRNFWSGLSTKKKTHVVVKFCAQKSVGMQFHVKCFQSIQGLVQMKWGLEWECMQPLRFLNRRNFWSGLSTKKELMSLSNFALKNVSVFSFHEKCSLIKSRTCSNEIRASVGVYAS